jgi:mRNA interferase RelE/StbE
MYEVNYSQSAAKFIKKLPKKEQKHILAVIERARIRPESYFKRLVGNTTYKLRAGEYRIIADIFNDQLRILVVKIGHRKNIYKKLRL